MKPAGETNQIHSLPKRAHMRSNVRVLSVGLQQSLDMVYGSILMGRPCEITQVHHRNELDDIQASRHYDVAVLGEALSTEKLTEMAHLVRQRWPRTDILAVSAKPLQIDDALYDDRILPGYSAKVLLAEVFRLMDVHGRQRGSASGRWSADGE
jgi:hypothetical protein